VNARRLAVPNMTEEEVAAWVHHAMRGTLVDYLARQPVPEPPHHGAGGYALSCRCETCRAANRSYVRRWRALHHG
jgi:hypothetical protein